MESEEMNERYHLIIIGAGSAGLAASELASRLGAKVALAEKGRVGGDCTWTGCIPSKALLRAAEISHALSSAGGEPLEFGAAMERVREARERIYAEESPKVLQEKGIDVYLGEARFIDSRTIEVGGEHLKGRSFLITTGASPVIPPLTGLGTIDYLTYESVFDLEEAPGQLIILGGGPVGVEMAQAFTRFGCNVALVERENHILPNEELEASELIAGVLAAEGVDIHAGEPAQEVFQENGKVRLAMQSSQVEGDALMIAVGRRPILEGLELEAADIEAMPEGIPVDDYLRTIQPHIFAAGDVTGGYQFTHYAAMQALTAARNALFPGRSKMEVSIVPWATFTQPEVSRVGVTEEEARKAYDDKVMVTFLDFDKVDRAVAADTTNGFIKIVYVKSLRGPRLLGATIVGERAGELINEWVLVMSGKLSISDIANTIHVYPTYAIANQQAAGEVLAETYLKGWTKRLLRMLMR